MSKAFDSLHAALMIQKLEAYGFPETSLNLLLSFLEHRQSANIFMYADEHQIFTSDNDIHRPLQKRERTGEEYGCFPFVLKN